MVENELLLLGTCDLLFCVIWVDMEYFWFPWGNLFISTLYPSNLYSSFFSIDLNFWIPFHYNLVVQWCSGYGKGLERFWLENSLGVKPAVDRESPLLLSHFFHFVPWSSVDLKNRFMILWPWTVTEWRKKFEQAERLFSQTRDCPHMVGASFFWNWLSLITRVESNINSIFSHYTTIFVYLENNERISVGEKLLCRLRRQIVVCSRIVQIWLKGAILINILVSTMTLDYCQIVQQSRDPP